MIVRCRSWRARIAHLPAHAPGTCRTCWKPCRQHVRQGQKRCEDCLKALVNHPDPAVRRNAMECQVPTEHLVAMASDLDLSVSLIATDLLAARGITLNTTTTEPATGLLGWEDEQDQQ